MKYKLPSSRTENTALAGGHNVFELNARDLTSQGGNNPGGKASGFYYYRVETPTHSATRKMIQVK